MWKQLFSNKQLKEMRYIYILESYSAMKRNTALLYTTAGMHLHIMLCGRISTETFLPCGPLGDLHPSAPVTSKNT